MRQNAYYRNLKWTFEDLLQCYCYAIKTKITIIRYHVSHPASAGKGSEMSELRTRVANLAFLKPDFEILALFDHLWLFLEVKKSQTKSGFFWLFFSRTGLDLEKHCLSCIFITNLLWRQSMTMQDAQDIEGILWLPWKWSILLLIIFGSSTCFFSISINLCLPFY